MPPYFVEFEWDNPRPDRPDDINKRTVYKYVDELVRWYEKEKDQYTYNLEEATIELAGFQEELKRVKVVNRKAEKKEKDEEKLFPTLYEQDCLDKASRERTDVEVGLQLVIKRLETSLIPKFQKKLRQIDRHVFVLGMIDMKISAQEAMESVERVLETY